MEEGRRDMMLHMKYRHLHGGSEETHGNSQLCKSITATRFVQNTDGRTLLIIDVAHCDLCSLFVTFAVVFLLLMADFLKFM